MAYQINRFDGSLLTVVEDGTKDDSTDINLVGKNFAGYGEVQNENFVFLLENFASLTPPPRPISGQIWFDLDTSKLKFYDGNRFRTTGGAEISDETPDGLTEGDFWWDTDNEQLYAYNGTDFVLIGPQDAGEGITQMQSASVLGTDGRTRSVILSVINDTVVHIISNEAFTIENTPENEIPGFGTVKKGITLKEANEDGVTTDYLFWGTASNANRLDGFDADNFVRKGDANFDSLVSFSDVGLAVGDSNDLRISIENDNVGTISNEVGNSINFKLKNPQGIVKDSLRLSSDNILPGLQADNESIESVSIGSEDAPFLEIFADNFTGTAEKSTALVVNGESRLGDTAAEINTVAIRDASGDLRAQLFRGTALTARYADLAEKYTANEYLSVGTVCTICSHPEHEIEAINQGETPIGVTSESPAYLMNSESDGQIVALKGRVPVRIVGPIKKSQKVYARQNGTGSEEFVEDGLIGIALETNLDSNEKLVECFLMV